ncbi:hypothetical protein GCM10010399_52960 [Dactylosporangium fulvum]|uniref:DUF1801 domain-containing protein n=1 Tax=Dactylosporangium fulvum TaxID=53359 RepID=A0ABY5VNJ1_9ACTN|nr:DUF1801 domain-containing protein [Dactylosporangium fulvum]UWP79045.1 DUF1801 domain-containing protein [Dactylosporangium fulvum]
MTEQHDELLEIVRELMREHAPQAAETISRGSPAWKSQEILAIVSHSKTHLTLAFTHGAEFDDPHGLLEGIGKNTRHVKLKLSREVPRAALGDYIRQAADRDRA